MSLFDSLRWPISDQPTSDELLALPTALLTQWMMDTEWIGNNKYTPTAIAQAHATIALRHIFAYYDGGLDPDILLLRRMILDYEHI